jgi:glyoxylase I family protein
VGAQQNGRKQPLAKALNHVSVCVPELEAGRHFYEDILGLERVPRPDLGVPGIWLKAGEYGVHLIVPPPGEDTGQPPRVPSGIAMHFAFSVDDYDATLALLQAHNLTVVEGRFGIKQMWVQDPGGNVVELIPTR